MSELTKDQWLRRCADQYVAHGGMNEKEALDAAEVCWEEWNSEPEIYYDVTPEGMAHADMDCWDSER